MGPVRPNETQSEQVARSAGIVSGAILVSRITGLAREMVMANKFGAGFSYDAFLLAFRFPSMMRTLFAEGALSSAFDSHLHCIPDQRWTEGSDTALEPGRHSPHHRCWRYLFAGRYLQSPAGVDSRPWLCRGSGQI